MLWRGVSTCVKPQTDREGHGYVWKHNNRMNKVFFSSLSVCVSLSADDGEWTHNLSQCETTSTQIKDWFEPVQI